jgi:hypothetical protein
MVQHERQDLHHLPVASRTAEQVVLKSLEGIGQFQERRAIA